MAGREYRAITDPMLTAAEEGYVDPRIRAASAAAFFAPSTPTHATGTPGGICTIDSSASRPSSTLFDDRSGTPMTGRSVCAATTPGRAAARPAPAINTRRPRSRAVRAYSATASGVRWAERTSSSCAIPRASSSATQSCIRSMSDSEPTRIPTTGAPSATDLAPLGRGECDVGPPPRALERDVLDGPVGEYPRSGEIVADSRHPENPPPVRDQPVA